MTDVLIMGDGPAGLAAAITLRQQGNTVSVIRRKPKQQTIRLGESLTSTALLSIKALGLLNEFYADNHQPCYGNCSSWGNNQLSYFDFIQSPTGTGWYVDRPKFELMLRRKALACGVNIMDSDGVATLKQNDQGWGYQHSGRCINAKVIIDASGRQAWLSRQLGIGRSAEDKQVAIVTVLKGNPAFHTSHSMVEAVRDGWWYVADAVEQTICIFFTDPDLHRRSNLTELTYWKTKMEETVFVKHRLPPAMYQPVESPGVTSAASSGLAQYAGPGWFAAGDAAYAMDPLSSHGIAFALRSGIDAGLGAARSLQGDTSAEAEYDQKLRLAAQIYSEQRLTIYHQEMRWADMPYWQRRHQLVPAANFNSSITI